MPNNTLPLKTSEPVKFPNINEAVSAAKDFYFKPYSTVEDFAKACVYPVVSFSTLALVASVLIIAPVVTIPVSLGAFLVAAGAFLNGSENLAKGALSVGLAVSLFSIVGPILGVICAILAPISIPICTTAIMTRTFASIFSLPSSLNDNSQKDNPADESEIDQDQNPNWSQIAYQ